MALQIRQLTQSPDHDSISREHRREEDAILISYVGQSKTKGRTSTMTMIYIAGAVFAVFVILFFVGYTAIMAAGQPPQAATGAAPVSGREYVLYGATLIDDGCQYYPDWHASMLRAFEGTVEPHLEEYFRVAQAVARHPREQWEMLAEVHLATTDAVRDDS